MKSIKSKVTLSIIVLIVISLLLVGGASMVLNFMGTFSALDQTMRQIAAVTADRVAHELNEYKNIAMEAGMDATLSNNVASIAEQESAIKERVAAHGLAQGNLLDKDGFSIFDGNNYSDRQYFQDAIQGNISVSDPLTNRLSGETTVIISAPLWKNGKWGGTVWGAVYFAPTPSFLNDIVSTIQVGNNGYAYILNSAGDAIAQPAGIVLDTSETGPLTDISQRMVQGEKDFATYTENGSTICVAYAPIPGTNGWSIAVNAPVNDFMGQTLNGLILMLCMLAFFIVAACLLAAALSRRISKPIQQCASRLALLAEGDLTTPVPETHSRDETGMLLGSLKETIEILQAYIHDLSRGMGELAKGNLDVTPDVEFKGEFVQLRNNMIQVIDAFNTTLTRLGQSADELAGSSEQVAMGSQALSDGSIQQAGAVQQLSATVTGISTDVRNNASSAVAASRQVADVAHELTKSNQKMQQLIGAMNEISDSSGKISKIIKTIEDIAFQTNILALNAAVEAARAGTAGRGFAVVANEVRSLAAKSQEAAKSTASLIQNSTDAVQRGTQLADDTAKALLVVVEGAQVVTSTVDRIATASSQQSAAIGDISRGIEQISSVVQTNSATAQESAATSEELSGQAQLLRDMVGHFRLRGTKKCEVKKRPVASGKM